MKKYLIILSAAAAAIILPLIFSFKAEQSAGESIMIRAVQGGRTSDIFIYKGSGQVEHVTLPNSVSPDDFEKNYDQIFTTVKNYEKLGYKVGSHSIMMYGRGVVDAFILSKN